MAYVHAVQEPGSADDPEARLRDKLFVVLVDLATGKKTYSAVQLPFLSNGAPLSFGRRPSRICVFDYSQWAFAVPSMTVLAHTTFMAGYGGQMSAEASKRAAIQGRLARCEEEPQEEKPDARKDEDARSRLDRRVCNVAGRLTPRFVCEPPPRRRARGGGGKDDARGSSG